MKPSIKINVQNKALYILFIKLTKTLDTLGRTRLYKGMERIGCPLNLLQMIHAFYDRLTARVAFDVDISESFNLRCGDKQGCVMPLTIFCIYLSALLYCSLLSLDGRALHTRHDRNLFNLSHLRAKTNTNAVLIHEVLFANNVVFCANNVHKLQEKYDVFSTSCNLSGLKISTKKIVTFATNGPPSCTQI